MNALRSLACASIALAAGAGCGTETAPSSGRSVATLPDGSWIIAGRFEGDLSFPGRREVASSGRRDLFVARYGPGGKVDWARAAGGAGQDEAWDVAVVENGSALVTGEFEQTAAFAGDTGRTATLVSAGETDAFFARYDARGNLEWACSAGGLGQDFGRAAASCPDGSFVVAGRFEGELVFARGEPGETRIVCPSEPGDGASAKRKEPWRAFVAKLTAEGSLVWVVTIAGAGAAYAQDVTGLADGSCLVVGSFQRSVHVGDPKAGGVRLESAGDDDLFVCKLDRDGTPLWARSAGGAGEDSAHGVSAFVDGSCVVTGRFAESAIFGPKEPAETRCSAQGDQDIFVARYDGDGQLLWARAAGGPASDYGRAVAARADETCLVTGYFREEAVFGAGEKNETRLTSDGDLDVFVARLDQNGRLIEVGRFGRWGSERSNGIATLADGSFVLAGERPIDDYMKEEELLVTHAADLASIR